MSKDVMKLALEALEPLVRRAAPWGELDWLNGCKAISALREALAEPDFWEGYVPEPVKPAPSECQTEAEKTAYAFGWWKALESQRALDKKAENARELGLDYEPVCNKDPQGCWNVRCQLGKKCKNASAQQEPVAWVCYGSNNKLDIDFFEDEIADLAVGTMLYTHAQRTWVGLDDKDYRELHLQMGPTYFYQDYGRAIEAKLKEMNT